MNPKKLTKGRIISPPKSFKAKMKNQEHKSLLFCEKCPSVFYQKSWRHLNQVDISDVQKQNLKKTICPACLMEKTKNYEGEIIMNFFAPLNDQIKQEIKNLIINISNKEYERNPLSRLGEFQESENQWKIFFTDNQLAKRIAQKIKKTFLESIFSQNQNIEIKFAEEKRPKTRITMTFK